MIHYLIEIVFIKKYIFTSLKSKGGQEFLGEDNFVNHGNNKLINCGNLFIYIKEFND